MESGEDAWYKRAKDFSPEKFDADVDKIAELYHERGFVNARVVSHEADIDRESNTADLRVTVEEGPRIIVKRVDVEVERGEGEDAREVAAGRRSRRGPAGARQALRPDRAGQDARGDVLGPRRPGLRLCRGRAGRRRSQGDSLDLTFKVRPRQAVSVGQDHDRGQRCHLREGDTGARS